jgi:YrbI family 3-deoxy-D-manno-octulosonate 8-phosphate phosphatase
VTMTPFHFFVWRETAAGGMQGVNHEASRRLMRQQREPEYLEVGAVYAMRTAGLLEHRFRFFGRVGKYLLPASRAIEIDEPEDWALAEMLMRSRDQDRPRTGSEAGWDKVRAVVSDFDGVMTDNRVIVDQQGGEAVVCNRGDGWGISLLKREGILVACISTEENPVVRARCEKLGIPYWQGQQDKLAALQAFLDQHELGPEECLYVGNDTNDSACLQHAGIAVVPRDAAPEVQHLAHWQTKAAGGEGVLREIAGKLLKERQRDEC